MKNEMPSRSANHMKPKQATIKQYREKRKKKKRLKKEKIKAFPVWRKTLRYVRKGIGYTVLVGIVGGIGGAVWFWDGHGKAISGYITEGYAIAATIERDDFTNEEPTVLYDKNGELLVELKERNYKYLSIVDNADLYKKVSDVVVPIEDERYYEHQGFDYYGVGVAVVNYLKGGELRGASTITQQLVKNVYLSQEQSLPRKIKEAVISQELENQFSKEEILEFYVNDNYYANGQYGLGTAAYYYYGKEVADLTVGELAVLVGIPNNPTIYDPTTNPENATVKRNTILAKMMEYGTLTPEAYNEEVSKEIVLDVHETAINNAVTGYAESFALYNTVTEIMDYEGFNFDYWFDTDEEQVAYDASFGETYEEVYQDVLNGGYKIETSIDKNQQKILQDAVDNAMNAFTYTDDETGLYTKQAAATTIDNSTGEVVAIVGGRSQDGNSYNRAYLAARQPGSSIKPFISYAPAYESGYNTGSLIEDKAIENGPKNWYDGYWGNVTLRYAMEQSINTVAYRLLAEYGPAEGIQKLAKMQFNSLEPTDDDSPIVAVGGFTYGATTTEMSGALSTLVNGGNYIQPTNVRKITVIQSEEVVYDRENDVHVAVYDEGAAYMTLDTMKNVVDTGIGLDADWGYEFLAGKTGTTDESKDLWFVGATPYYATSVWVGDDTPTAQSDAVANRARTIFKQAMAQYHTGLAVIDFTKPTKVTKKGTELYNNLAEENTYQAERESDEAMRKNEDLAFQTDRLADLDYRLVYGLSAEEETAYEQMAEAKLTALQNVTLTDLDDMNEVETLYEDAKKQAKLVKRSSYALTLNANIEEAWATIEEAEQAIKAQIAYDEKQAKLKAEAAAKAKKEATEAAAEAKAKAEAEAAIEQGFTDAEKTTGTDSGTKTDSSVPASPTEESDATGADEAESIPSEEGA